MASQHALNLCFTSSELTPLAKTGGLGDVCAALAVYLHRSGHDVRVLIPRYAAIDQAGVDIRPVEGLANLSLRVGARELRYSIDATTLPGTSLRIYLLRCPEFFARESIYTQDADEQLRFGMLSRAAIQMCQHLGFAPDLFHCHDWQTSLIPVYLRSIFAWDKLFADTKCVLTIHNIGYQGIFPAYTVSDLSLSDAEQHLYQDDLKDGVINFLKTGVLHADVVTTVSPTYAREILSEEYGMGLDSLLRARSGTVVGILNGVDYAVWNPATDPLIPANFSPSDMTGKRDCKLALASRLGLAESAERPLVGLVSRLVGQKGIELIEQVVPELLTRRDFALVVLGSGEAHYEQFFQWLQSRFPDRVSFYRGYHNELAHWIEAGSDMFLMPSRYEPCGLNQMYSLKYGTVPIVRETGGLADSVEPFEPQSGAGTGIVFRDYNASGLAWALNRALDIFMDSTLWQKLVANGMAQDFSWEQQGDEYVQLFRQLTGKL